MAKYINEDFLLIDYHCHLSPREIVEDISYNNAKTCFRF